MSTVGFHDFKSNIKCSICIGTRSDPDTVAHNGAGGESHPWHRECIKNWLVIGNGCPSCRVPLDKDAMFSWKERVIIELNHIKNVAPVIKATTAVLGIGLITVALGTGITKAGMTTASLEIAVSTAAEAVGPGGLARVVAGTFAVAIGAGVAAGVIYRFGERRGLLPHLDFSEF